MAELTNLYKKDNTMKIANMNPIQFINHLTEQAWQSGAAYRLACRNWLAHNQEVASTKVELAFGDDAPSPSWLPTKEELDRYEAEGVGRAPCPQEEMLKARRARLLERIQLAQEWMDLVPGDNACRAELGELKDELAVVESALGHPEPKEPRESTQDHCPTCLCLYEHEDPMQSCRCGG